MSHLVITIGCEYGAKGNQIGRKIAEDLGFQFYDRNIVDVDLNDFMECKNEMFGLIKELFVSCAAVAVGVHSFGNMCAAEAGTLDFWGNAGNLGISLDTIKQHCSAAREYVTRIQSKRQARKYLTRLKQLGPEIL